MFEVFAHHSGPRGESAQQLEANNKDNKPEQQQWRHSHCAAPSWQERKEKAGQIVNGTVNNNTQTLSPTHLPPPTSSHMNT